MATSFSGTINIGFALAYLNLNDFSNARDDLNLAYSLSLTDGTGANQAQKLFRDQRTVTTGANDDLDLAGGVTDAFGQTLTFTAVKVLWIYAAIANTTNLTIGGSGSTWVGWNTGTNPAVAPIVPGGGFLLTNPSAAGFGTITGGSADLLRITNAAGASAVYDIIIIGEG